MINIKFLDLPKLDLPRIFYKPDNHVYHTKRPGYTAHEIIDQTVLKQIQEMFHYGPEFGRFHTNVQIINPNFNSYIHWDPREYAINYILNLGGSNVITTFYDAEENPVESAVLPLETWHILNVQQLHAVHNIESERIAITLSFRKLSETMRDWLTTCHALEPNEL